jgi:hypothetical protein
MPFFTSQQLFGNGAGAPGGAGWVPVDTTAPPTFSANNRGIAFGEQLTSAIANRPHYALALNDDDLNTRLAEFEASGLDAVYRAGLVADPEVGRLVTLDGGAIETVTTMAAQYVDKSNSHFRANAIGNNLLGGGGFEFVGLGTGGGGDALFGFMDRRRLELASEGSVIAANEASTLNPGGAGATQVSLNSGTVHTALTTGLLLGVDLVEVSGTAGGTYDGVYIVMGLVPGQNARCTVLRLDGSAPSFPSNTAATVNFMRPVFGSFNPHGHDGSAYLGGVLAIGMPTSGSSIDAIVTTGVDNALRVRRAAADGVLWDVSRIDPYGRHINLGDNELITADAARTGAYFGTSAGFAYRETGALAVGTNYDSGYVTASHAASGVNKYVYGATVIDTRYDTGSASAEDFTFSAGGVVTLGSASANFVGRHIVAGVTIVEVLTPSQYAGYYRVSLKNASTDQLTLVSLDGGSPNLPASGSGTLRVAAVASLGHQQVTLTGASLLTTGTFWAGAVLQAPRATTGRSEALLLVAGEGSSGGPNGLIRGVQPTAGSGTNTDEDVFYVGNTGEVRTRNAIYVDYSSGGYRYRSNASRRIILDLSTARSAHRDYSGYHDVPHWRHDANGFLVGQGTLGEACTLYVPLSSVVRTEMQITFVHLRANFAQDTTLYLQYAEVGTGSPPTWVDHASVANVTNAVEEIEIDLVTLGDELDIDRSLYEYRLRIVADEAGTTLYGASITVSDPGPVNT